MLHILHDMIAMSPFGLFVLANGQLTTYVTDVSVDVSESARGNRGHAETGRRRTA